MSGANLRDEEAWAIANWPIFILVLKRDFPDLWEKYLEQEIRYGRINHDLWYEIGRAGAIMFPGTTLTYITYLLLELRTNTRREQGLAWPDD